MAGAQCGMEGRRWGQRSGDQVTQGLLGSTWVFYVITWQDLSSRLLRLLIGGWAGGGGTESGGGKIRPGRENGSGPEPTSTALSHRGA